MAQGDQQPPALREAGVRKAPSLQVKTERGRVEGQRGQEEGEESSGSVREPSRGIGILMKYDALREVPHQSCAVV